MAKNDQQDSFEKHLSANHSRMTDLVKFAETKNAALLTFCSVWMGSIIVMLRSADELPMGYRTAFLVVLPFLAIAAVITLISFLPRLLHHYHRPAEASNNLLYFSDVAKISTDRFGEALRERYFPSEGQSATEAYLDDLALQAAIQAKIAQRKFTFFNNAGRLVLASFICMAIPPVVWTFKLVWTAAINLVDVGS